MKVEGGQAGNKNGFSVCESFAAFASFALKGFGGVWGGCVEIFWGIFWGLGARDCDGGG